LGSTTDSLPEQDAYWDKVAEEKAFPAPFKINLLQNRKSAQVDFQMAM